MVSNKLGHGSMYRPRWDGPDWSSNNHIQKLDDGWPESVEEQGLLLLVWRHHITKQYIKDVL